MNLSLGTKLHGMEGNRGPNINRMWAPGPSRLPHGQAPPDSIGTWESCPTIPLPLLCDALVCWEDLLELLKHSTFHQRSILM